MASSDYDLSPTEVADLLHVHVETVKRWARDGKLRSWTTPGGWRKFSQADIDTFIAENVSAPPAEQAS